MEKKLKKKQFLGQPKKNKEIKLSRKITIRFTQNDYDKLIVFFKNDYENKFQLSLSSQIRDVLLQLIHNKKIKINKIYSPKYINELNKIGINLNQITKKINIKKMHNDQDLKKISMILNQIETIIHSEI